MSGPWDRPPSPQPDDEWPSEDLREPREEWTPAEPARDAGPSPSSGWDDWGSPASPDAYLIEEPDLPTTDLWSESWGDEAAAPAAWTEPEPPVTRSEPAAPEARTAPDAWPDAPRVADTPVAAPFDRAERFEPEPGRTTAPEPAFATEPARSEPHPEPWAYDVDPWAPEPEAPAAPIPSAPIVEPTDFVPEPRSADAEPSPPAFAPDDEPYPEPDVPRGGAPEPAAPSLETSRPAPTVADADTDAPDLEMEAAPSAQAERVAPADTEPDAEPAPMPDAELAPPDPEPGPPAETPRRPWWAAGRASWLGEPAPEDETSAATGESAPATAPAPETAEATAAPADVLEAGVAADDSGPVAETEAETSDAEPRAGTDATVAGAEPAVQSTDPEPSAAEGEAASPAIDVTPDDEPESGAAEDEKTQEPLEPSAPPSMEPVWTAEPWPPAIADAAPEPAIEPEARDFESAAAALGLDIDPEPFKAPAASAPVDPAWPDEMEGTQVFPSGWRPPAAPPPARSTELEPEAGAVRTTFTPTEDADPDAEAGPTTAEQAVPWLIGVILLLAGLVIVLLALIFAGDASLGGEGPGPSNSLPAGLPSASPGAVAEATPTPRSTASAAPSVSSVPTPTPLAIPEYGPLEMVYLGRSAPLAHIFLLRHDFTVQGEPEVLAQDPDLDVRSVAWSPDGTYGAGLYADLLISIEPGAAKRRLADGISAITFGPDPATLYAVRVTQDGTNDVAAVLSFDYATGDATEIASVSYARPSLGTEDAATEAQFIDDGGPIRLFWMESGVLRLWILGGGVWEMPPAGGEATKRDVDVPLLYASRSNRQVVVAEDGTTSTLSMLNGASETVATTSVEGLVSHLRWSPSGDRVVFTLARTAAGGGVLQDLFLWDLGDGEAPTQLTATGAAFSAEWLGATPLWRE